MSRQAQQARRPHYQSLKPLLLWRDMARPVDWASVFGRPAELVVELGCGNGELLVRRATAEPERNFIGIDMDWQSVRRALRRIAQSGAANVRLVQSRGPLVMARLLQANSITEAYAAFPCPWPNDRHLGRRLFSRDFLSLAANRLKPGAGMWIVSDEPSYLDWIEEQAESSGLAVSRRGAAPPLNTKYERKWLSQGLAGFERLELSKKRHPRVAEAKEPEMKFHWIEDCRPERLELTEEVGPLATVSFKDFIYDPRSRKGMLRTVAVEDGIKQGFWIEIGRDPDAARPPWRIRLAPGCGVLPTVGVQRALDLAEAAALKTVQ